MSEETRTETALTVPEFDLQARLREHRLYLKACRLLLNDEDYAVIKGRKFRKRSGWAKLRKAFDVSTEIVQERYLELRDTWGYSFTVRATLPNGRWEESDGLVTYEEIWRVRLKAAITRKRGKKLTPAELTAIQEDITDQDVRGKALTRAKSRATSDVLGAGVVSAEEATILKAHWIDDSETRTRFWGLAKSTLKLSQEQVYQALGVKKIPDFTGTMKDAKRILEEAAIGPNKTG